MKRVIPLTWKWVTLNDIAKWGSGGTPKSTVIEYYNGTIPFLIIGDLNDNYITKSKSTITEAGLNNSSAKIVQPGSVLIAMYGSIGKLGINKIPVTTNQAIAFTKELFSTVYNKYLFWYLFSIRNKLLSMGKGGTQQNISQTVLKTVDFPLPPLPEQHRIVAKIEELFSELDNGIAQLKKVKEQLKVYRQSVLKWAFEGKLTNKDVKDGELPKGWEKTTLSEICEMKAGLSVRASEISKSKDEGLFPCYGGNGLRGYTKSYTHIGKFLLIGRQGALCGNVHLVNGKFHATEHAVVVSVKNKVDTVWLYYKLTSMKLNQYSAGMAQPGLSVKKLLPLEIIYPPVFTEQHQIVREIESRLSVADKLEKTIEQSLQQAEALRQSILKRAFEGKLVP